MEYKVRQNFFSIGDRFAIQDSNGNDIFIVQAKIFTIGKKLTLYNLKGEELVFIEQKLFKFLPEYHIYIKNMLVARIKSKFAFFSPKLTIDSDAGAFSVNGNIFAYDFIVSKDNRNIARVSKKIFTWTDSYQVYVDDDEDQALMLALVIVIDQIYHNDKND